MARRFRVLVLAMLLGCLTASAQAPQDRVNIAELNAEVDVLRVLAALGPTVGQMKQLQTLSARTMPASAPTRQVKASANYHKTLAALRDAILEKDDDRISQYTNALNDLAQKESLEFDPVEITAEARKQAPAVVRSLSARQVAVYVGGIADFPDPRERIEDALTDARKLTGKEWLQARDDTAYVVGWLTAGLDTLAEKRVRESVVALLDKAHKLPDNDFTNQRAFLLAAGQTLVGKTGPTDVIRHYMERVMAETLSNHRLDAALKVWAKKK